MKILSKTELKTLIEQAERPCVSLFLPTHRGGAETRQDPIRLKNLLGQAEEQLPERGMRPEAARDMLDPVRQLLDDATFWQNQGEGLAVFCAPNMFRTYRLPLHVEELVVIADRFHIKPLMSLFNSNDRFYILAFSHNVVRLLQGTRYSVCEVALEDVPKNIEEALQHDDPEKQSQFYTGMPGANVKGGGAGGGKRPAVAFGTGAQAFENSDLTRYSKRVDKGLWEEVLHDEQAPLVLAGVEHLLPIYRDASSYNNILDGWVTGNPDTLEPAELHAQAWKVVEPYFQQAQEVAAEHYGNATGQGLASSDIQEIVPAAYNGRVNHLFVAVGEHQWGTFDPAQNRVNLEQEASPTNEDLLDFAAAHTFLNSGAVFAVNPEDVPEKGAIAAVFRY